MLSEQAKKNCAVYRSKWIKKNLKGVDVRLDRELIDTFNSILKTKGESRAGVIRQMIEKYIEENKSLLDQERDKKEE